MNRMRMLGVLAVMTAGLVTGCKKTPPAAAPNSYTQAAVAAGGTLNSDGSVTNANGTITEPNGTVVPGNQATPNQASVAVNPASAGAMTAEPASSGAGAAMTGPVAPPPPVAVTAPAGTAVVIRTTQQLAASHNEVGDRFNGVLERPVVYHGVTVFERGTPVSGEVTASKGKGRFKGAGDLGITLTAIGKHEVRTSEYVLNNKGRGKRTGAFIGGGAGLGALIGGLAGGGKGAVIGGLAGAGGGTAASAYTGSRDVIIRSESVITFRLRAAVSR